MSFQISDSTHIYNVLVNSLKGAGFELLDDSPKWNILWTRYVEAGDVKKLNKYQKINHFPQSIHLSRKDLLWKCMLRFMKRFPREFNITPITYVFPEDSEQFEHDRETEDGNVLYILKPVAASCGRGIKVIGKRTPVIRKDGYLASKYVCKPHLINDLKYDLRVYVLVTSYEPLRIYVYNDGLVRFATEKYTLDPDDLKKRFIHLTNFSVNKKSENFKINQGTGEDEENSSKWSFKALKKAYDARGISYDFVFAQIKDVIVKTLISVEPYIVGSLNKCPPGNRQSCFELYGFDVLIDESLKPWLLEVNVFPSLSSSSPFDKIVKSQLICDVFTLIGIRGYDK
jgi:tubulin polyglutamylase TTLL4